MKKKRLREARNALGMTQGQLADELGYAGKNVIWMKENGSRPITRRDELSIEALLARRPEKST